MDVTGDGLPEIIEWNGNSYYAPVNLLVIGKDPFLGYSLIETVPVLPQGGSVTVASLFVADLNEDGKLDFVTQNYGYYVSQPGVSVILSTPTGYAPAQEIYKPYNAPSLVTVGDFDGDHHVDIAVVADQYNNTAEVWDGDTLTLLKGDGHGTFTQDILTVFGRRDLGYGGSGDFNNDGRADLFFFIGPSDGNFGGTVFDHVDQLSGWTLLSNGHGGFDPTTPTPYSLRSAGNVTGTGFGLADLDQDGFLDVVLGTTDQGKLAFALNDGTGTVHAQPSKVSFGLGPLGNLTFADFNNDGLMDFAGTDNPTAASPQPKRG
jgi:hypothetical protein